MKKYIAELMATLLLVSGVALAQPGRGNGWQSCLAQLKLTTEQQTQISKLRSQFQKEAVDIRASIAKARIDLRELFAAEKTDRALIEKKMREISDLTLTLKLKRLDHWEAINKVLTPEQQKEWKKFRSERMFQGRMSGKRMMNPRGGMMGGWENAPLPPQRSMMLNENEDEDIFFHSNEIMDELDEIEPQPHG